MATYISNRNETVVVSGALAYFGVTNSLKRQIESVPEDDLLAK